MGALAGTEKITGCSSLTSCARQGYITILLTRDYIGAKEDEANPMIPVSSLEPWIQRIIVAAWRRVKRPRIDELRAPVNLFEHVQPHTSLSYVQDLFGTPHRTDKQWITYSFKDVLVQITTKDSTTIAGVDILLKRPRKFTTFRIYPLQYILGKITLADVLEKNIEIKKENSSKFFCVYLDRYFGFPGKYFYYTFGTYFGPGVRASKFDWDHQQNVLLTDPRRVRINWVGIGATDEKRYTPNFYHFI